MQAEKHANGAGFLKIHLATPVPDSTDMPADSGLVQELSTAQLHIEGRMPNSSNATFLVTVGEAANNTQGIYKPLRGERPLWDFEPGLYKREVAAFRLSEALGYDIVPPTVICDGPLGEGSLQLFINYDPAEHYFVLYESRPELHSQLRTMAIFDIVANNTDRKGGHVVLDESGSVWGIDHGVCFSEEFKLRTVIWDFAGQPIEDEILAPLEKLIESVPVQVAALLTDDEIEAMLERTEWLLDNRVYPAPESRYQYPWPLL
jgi:uncharacterized repeat protein (TIGR03843 family)